MIDITCPNCNFSKSVPDSKIPQGTKMAKCPRCKTSFELPVVEEQKEPETFEEILDFEPVEEVQDVETVEDVEIVEEAETDRENSPEPDTEKMERPGGLSELYRTLVAVLFSPTEFFHSIRNQQGLKEPLIFGMLTGSFGLICNSYWMLKSKPEFLTNLMKLAEEPVNDTQMFISSIVFSPVYTIVSLFLITVFLHLFLSMLGGAQKGMEWTFKVAAYSFAPAVLRLIPVIGNPVASLWTMVIIVIGLRTVHETSNLKALLALLLPFFLSLVFLLLVLAAFLSLAKI